MEAGSALPRYHIFRCHYLHEGAQTSQLLQATLQLNGTLAFVPDPNAQQLFDAVAAWMRKAFGNDAIRFWLLDKQSGRSQSAQYDRATLVSDEITDV